MDTIELGGYCFWSLINTFFHLILSLSNSLPLSPSLFWAENMRDKISSYRYETTETEEPTSTLTTENNVRDQTTK